MSRYRLQPSPAQELKLAEHCRHARFVWNLAVEQHAHWRPGRASAPSYSAQARELTEARAAPIPAPGTKSTVGIDRGVAVSAALPTGELLIAPRLTASEQNRVLRLQRRLARAQRGSHRRSRLKNQLARLKMREVDRRKNWIEHVSTSLAQRFDLVRVENLNVRVMSRSARGTHAEPGTSVRAKARLNHAILTGGWGLLVTRLKHKAPGRVENIAAAYTSQTCHACGYCARENRKSQAEFLCVACGNADHAHVNAAKNIAVGRTVAARGDLQASAGSTKREPQLAPFSPLR